jgi:hypothetical protein
MGVNWMHGTGCTGVISVEGEYSGIASKGIFRGYKVSARPLRTWQAQSYERAFWGFGLDWGKTGFLGSTST